MVTQVKSNDSQPNLVTQRAMPVMTGDVLRTIHAEIAEMFGELQRSRITLAALDRICATRLELRAEITVEMQRIIEEQQKAVSAPVKKSKRR